MQRGWGRLRIELGCAAGDGGATWWLEKDEEAAEDNRGGDDKPKQRALEEPSQAPRSLASERHKAHGVEELYD